MRLLYTAKPALHEFFGDDIPHYAILTHRWETDEVTFQDLRDGKGPQMVGWGKVSGCCARAALDGWDYVWIDSCCIDKTSSSELSEAINSMFEWYRKAQVCYAYLSDVPTAEENPYDDASNFRESKWFTRGWTLQELLAPDRVEFFDRNWKPIGTKLGFTDLIQSITGITHLVDYHEASVAQKLSWASQRETTRLEDQAYCLLGLFNVHMPLLYGEGPKAFLRLQQEILGKTDDDSIFAWEGHGPGGLLASSPRLFQGAGGIVINKDDPDRPPHTMTSKGLGLVLALLSPDIFECVHGKEVRTRVLAPLNCKRVSSVADLQEPDLPIALVLYRQTMSTTWRRERRLVAVPVRESDAKARKRTLVYVPQPTLDDEKNFGKNIDQATGENSTRSRQPVIRTIDWRRQLCQSLDVHPESADDTLLDALEDASQKLREAATRTQTESESLDDFPRYQVIHRVKCASDEQVRLFVKAPFIVKSPRQRSHLRSDEQIYNFNFYLERNKTISFVVYKDYRCCESHFQQRLADQSETSDPATLLISEGVSIVSPDCCAAFTALAEEALAGIPHPGFLEVKEEFNSPYLWWFCRRQNITRARELLNKSHQDHISVFDQYLNDYFGVAWTEVDSLLSKGQMKGQYIDYLYAPNIILVARSDDEILGQQQAYFANSWLRTKSSGRAPSSDHSRSAGFGGHIEGTYWSFDGTFKKRVEQLNIGYLPSSSMAEVFNITDLGFYPIKYAKVGLEDALRARGMMFWKCRLRNYVSYQERPNDSIRNSTLRFMIDTAAYNQMNPTASVSLVKSQDEVGPDAMSKDEPPSDEDFLLCLPKTITGFNMDTKIWTTLDVSRIVLVEWNPKAFDVLVIDDSTKELILALVTSQINAERGRGNGLTILLHGPPGVGKTLTAESIAEVSKKPLYRVACGDIGTSPEEIEKYLETIFYLGGRWDCVILLDEADTFIEQRRLFDLQRNALVSVFLRTMDSHNGIIILTTNRIGTFDEAFKSRIQLNLRYNDLGETQRLQIWGYFISQIENLEEVQAHLPDLAKVQMNGRQIRQTIITALQLARFRKEGMTYHHLQLVIEQQRRFESLYEQEVSTVPIKF